jgi:hypothetical protein
MQWWAPSHHCIDVCLGCCRWPSARTVRAPSPAAPATPPGTSSASTRASEHPSSAANGYERAPRPEDRRSQCRCRHTAPDATASFSHQGVPRASRTRDRRPVTPDARSERLADARRHRARSIHVHRRVDRTVSGGAISPRFGVRFSRSSRVHTAMAFTSSSQLLAGFFTIAPRPRARLDLRRGACARAGCSPQIRDHMMEERPNGSNPAQPSNRARRSSCTRRCGNRDHRVR